MVQQEGTIEIQKNTDVFLDIPPGIQGFIIAAVHTDPRPFIDVIPDDECLIAPIVTLCYQPRSEEYSLKELKKNPEHYFTIYIPHIAQMKKDLIIVRSTSELQPKEKDRKICILMYEITRGGDGKGTKGTFTTSDKDHSDKIVIRTQQFSNIISTCPSGECIKRVFALIYGGFQGHEKKYANIKVYLANALFEMKAHGSVSIKISVQKLHINILKEKRLAFLITESAKPAPIWCTTY